ncbi:MAG: hypothetical protein J6W80_01770 [Kiritimatiellae bacterium]|nr:hypothetical protein [Kiritimatiellia bacterium]
MKKIAMLAVAASVAAFAYAQETSAEAIDQTEEMQEAEISRQQTKPGIWPAFFAIADIPAPEQTPDVVGLRLTIPYSTKHESVTGFDLGFFGRTMVFEGFQLNILRNHATDQCTGFQVGLYNSIGQADVIAAQIGLWNDAASISGFQFGLVNVVGCADGFQIGVINRAEEMYGFQIGIVNIIRDAELRFFPLINIGF